MLRKVLATALPALMLCVSVSIPLLERYEDGQGTVIESEHEPGTCPTAHDHTVCTQVGANLSLAAAPVVDLHDHSLVRAALPQGTPTAHHADFLEGHPSRAPPLT